MELDKAIERFENNAEFERRNGNLQGCLDFRQLAEWLKALKEVWDSGDCNDCRNGQCEWKPKLGHLVRYNCPHYVGIANGEVNIDKEWGDNK